MSADICCISQYKQQQQQQQQQQQPDTCDYADPQLQLYEDAIEDIADRLLLLRLQLRRL